LFDRTTREWGGSVTGVLVREADIPLEGQVEVIGCISVASDVVAVGTEGCCEC
jgi:hypothetical protein